MKLFVALALIGAALTPAAPADCTVTDGELTWGFKESFRSYISGTIANGEWTVAEGAEYETPDFGFTGGVGSYEGGTGVLDFEGSITFTGHDGILNTTVANPQVRFEGSTAVLVLDVTGTTQEGEAVDATSVDFARLDLSNALTTDGGDVSVLEAPAVLSAAGAEAFGTYEAGEPLDAVTVTFTTTPDCAAQPTPYWLFALLALLVALVGTAVVLLIRRGLRARRSP